MRALGASSTGQFGPSAVENTLKRGEDDNCSSPPRDGSDTMFRQVDAGFAATLYTSTVYTVCRGAIRGGGLVMITAKWGHGQGW